MPGNAPPNEAWSQPLCILSVSFFFKVFDTLGPCRFHIYGIKKDKGAHQWPSFLFPFFKVFDTLGRCRFHVYWIKKDKGAHQWLSFLADMSGFDPDGDCNIYKFMLSSAAFGHPFFLCRWYRHFSHGICSH